MRRIFHLGKAASDDGVDEFKWTVFFYRKQTIILSIKLCLWVYAQVSAT
jgi:hypothetical protein